MITTVNKTINLCGRDVGKPIRVTINKLGKTWTEPVGWKANTASWLTVPNTSLTYIGRAI